MLGYMLKEQEGEKYRMGVDGEQLTLTVSRAFYDYLFYDYLMVRSSIRKDLKERVAEIRSVVGTDVVTFEMVLPFIPRPNRAHRTIDWDGLAERSEQVSLLLSLLNFTEAELHRELRLSRRPQLLAIQTGCVRRENFASSPIEIGLHPAAFEILADEFKIDTNFIEIERVIFDCYAGMSCRSQKERIRMESNLLRYGASFTGICAAVRAGGTPHFTVPGNCACLGASPDEFKDRLTMHSHNLDSSLQQLAMLAGIITFWNDILVPKWLEKTAKEASIAA